MKELFGMLACFMLMFGLPCVCVYYDECNKLVILQKFVEENQGEVELKFIFNHDSYQTIIIEGVKTKERKYLQGRYNCYGLPGEIWEIEVKFYSGIVFKRVCGVTGNALGLQP